MQDERGKNPQNGDERAAARDADERARRRLQRSKAAAWARYSTLGMQFTITPVIFGYAGYWLDDKFGWSPWGTISGVVFGFVGASVWLYYKIYPYEPKGDG